MAVQKSRASHSKIRLRRAHDHLKTVGYSIEKASETKLHLNHHLTEDGFYGGKQVIAPKVKATEVEQTEA